ncbi:MAG: anaerobic sulfite reductase subunit AsrB [Eubacterium sp.]
MTNEYIPFLSEIIEIFKHTDIEYTFRMRYTGDVKPGQFFEVSLPKFGEAPISVSGIGADTIDLTIRKVGKVTDEIFKNYVGKKLFLRGPYGNGFDIENYKGKDVIVVAGGTGLSPVKGIVDYFAQHPEDATSFTLIAGFKTPMDVLFKEDFERWNDTINVVLTVDCDGDDYVCNIGRVTEYIPGLVLKDKDNLAVIIVGPPIMMKFTVEEFLKRDVAEEKIWISQERKMCCGLGKCGHCKMDAVYICLDGPVFNYTIGKKLVD